MLDVDSISADYGGVPALWDVSFLVPKGGIVSLIGSNGAGKTTTLRAISRLVHVGSGSVRFDGVSLDRSDPHEVVAAGIAHVPEGRELFPEMTVVENLELGAFLPEARQHVSNSLNHVFELFPILGERRRQAAGTLSGGEQQMLAIGRGLMLRPRLLMLDEPSLGLAPLAVDAIFERVKEINAAGVTILLVEQDIEQALALADTAYVLENGRVSLKGQASTLGRDPEIRKAYLGL